MLKVVDVEPFLGDAGGVPPWDLTDAVDRGDTTKSLLLLHRMMRAGERHPLQVMAILHSHYTKLLTLDGANANDESSAAAVLGIKPGFPAKKALDQYRKLGNAGVVRAIGLLAQADLDLRGAKEWPDELVMEVLVARLSRLGRGPPLARTHAAGVDLLHQAALATCGLVLVDDTLGRGHVEALHGEPQRLFAGLGTDGADGVLAARLQLALDRLVALGSLGVGEDSLLLTLDVCHVADFSSQVG